MSTIVDAAGTWEVTDSGVRVLVTPSAEYLAATSVGQDEVDGTVAKVSARKLDLRAIGLQARRFATDPVVNAADNLLPECPAVGAAARQGLRRLHLVIAALCAED